MKTITFLLLLVALAGCGKQHHYVDLRQRAKLADVIVLADVRRDGKTLHLYAKEVLKGSLGPRFDYSIGEEIAPFWEKSGPEDYGQDHVVLFYSRLLGTFAISEILNVTNGIIHTEESSDPGKDIDVFRKFTKEPNQALEPTTLLVTPRACARVAPSRVVAHL